MHVKPRVGPGEHAVRRLDIHEFPAPEQTQHRPSEGLGECRDIAQRQRHEGAVAGDRGKARAVREEAEDVSPRRPGRDCSGARHAGPRSMVSAGGEGGGQAI